MELSSELIGTLGCMIGNSALRRVWTDELERIKAQAAGPPDLRPYIPAALERECATASETANQTARNEFKLAVQSYEAKEITPSSGSRGGGKRDFAGGFVANVDRISAAEDKHRRPRVRHAVRRVQ